MLLATGDKVSVESTLLYFSERSPHIHFRVAHSTTEISEGVKAGDLDVVVLDSSLEKEKILESVAILHGEGDRVVPAIVVLDRMHEELTETVLTSGAADVVLKSDYFLPRLRAAIENACERSSLAGEVAALRKRAEEPSYHGTLRSQAEEDAAKGEQKFRELADLLPILVFETDERGKLTFANRACIEAFGVTSAKFESGVTPIEFVGPEDAGKAREALARVLEGSSLKPERLNARRAGGAVFPALVSASPIMSGDRPVGVRGFLVDMSNLDAMQSAIQEGEEKFRTLVESSVMGVYIIQDDKFAYVNPAMGRIFGYTQAEFISLDTIFDVIIPSDRDKVRENIRKRIEGEWESVKYTFRCNKKTGEKIDVEVFGSRTVFWGRAAVIGTLEDITQRREAEERLRQSEDRYRTLFDESIDAIYISTPSGRMLDINSAGLRLFGYNSKEELLGEESLETYYENPIERRKFMSVLETEGFVRDFETRLRRKDGQVLAILDSATAVHNGNGEIVAYRGILRDITERKRLEEQLFQSQKLESLGQLTSGIAHDFNNVLGGIIGFAELALGKIDEKNPVYNYLKRIYSLADRAAKITKQLLAFARRQILMPKDINLNSLIHDLIELLPRLMGEHVEISFIPGKDLATIHADPSQIEQVIINLAVNAADAMPDGGRLTIGSTNAFLDEFFCRVHSNVQPGSYVMISVSDTGTGIDPSIVGRIYEPFFTTKDVGRGTGLGLSVVHGIIRQHGGAINVYSEVGKGTTFKLYFPAIARHPNENQQESEKQQILRTGNETILIVEDNEDLREFMQDLLEGSGYSVRLAGDGEEGISEFRKYPREVSLIITDVMMPKMSGKELKESIDLEFPGTKFLFISGYTESVVHHGFVLASQVDFLQKPFSAYQFSDKVRKILDR